MLLPAVRRGSTPGIIGGFPVQCHCVDCPEIPEIMEACGKIQHKFGAREFLVNVIHAEAKNPLTVFQLSARIRVVLTPVMPAATRADADGEAGQDSLQEAFFVAGSALVVAFLLFVSGAL